jgi:TolB-like protein/tRNA A-37 threonylcarbamoyl transferase component Bud32/Tfp pilus assembly protein PilF
VTVVELVSATLADRYRVEREIGRGGMATVYLAEDLRHRRKVAIKVLHPELAQSLGTERFLREIETTAGLRHPHILPLYDSGANGGFLFYVMPVVEGESLRDRLTREKQLPIDEALAITREVADALGYAHSRGVVHRDIKPENILLENGHAVVADFGIARAVSAAGGDHLTQTGTAIGTPRYMSPEQAAGERDVDGRSDLYSLGCVLYEMLGGQPPFTGPTAEVIARQHLVTEAAPITNLRPTVPPEVAGALSRTLAKNPADRFNPAAQFVHALAAPSMVTGVRPATAWPIAASRTRLALLATLALGAVALAWFGGRAWNSRPAVAPAGSIERIAVLPMDNQTGDTAQRFFADGMTREVIGVLSEVGVRVLGHRAVASYRETTLTATQIARELGVDAIVAGAVTRAGDVVQVAAELTDPRTGEALWSRTFSRPAADIVSLQREMAGEIARGISARLSPEQSQRLGAAPAVNPRAYAQYLLGVEQTNLRTVDGFRRSVEHLERSIAIDSTFAPAWGTMAMTHAIALFFSTITADSARPIIERATARATALDDRFGDAYVARGLLRAGGDWDFAAADRDLASGMARNPSTQARALYSWVLWETGRHEEAVAAIRKAIEIEPTTAQWHSDLGWLLWSIPDSAGSRAAAMRAIALDSTFYEPYHLLAWLELRVGNVAAMRAALQNARNKAGGDFWFRETLEGHMHVAAGDTAAARAVLARLRNDPRYAQRGWLLRAVGDVDGSYAMWNEAIDARDPDALYTLWSNPSLYAIHAEPRYQQLLARTGVRRTRTP